MNPELAKFCRERANKCREALERATTEEEKKYWREAEIKWRLRLLPLEPPKAGPETTQVSSQQKAIELRGAALSREALGAIRQRMSEWMDAIRASVSQRRRIQPAESAEDYRQRARACRKAAEDATDLKVREYWLSAEAYWLSLIGQQRD